jgi:predicted membrane chloride channel (bestrophin family)
VSDDNRDGLGPVVKVTALVVLEVLFSFLLAVLLPWERHHRLIAVGTSDQLLGVVLLAWPDLENQALRAFTVGRRGWANFVRSCRSAWRRAREEVKWWFQDRTETVANWYRRLTRRSRTISARVHAVTATARASVSATVMRGGTRDERLQRLENEVARLPGQWQNDMTNLRDRRVEFRYYGVPLILTGVVLLSCASW